MKPLIHFFTYSLFLLFAPSAHALAIFSTSADWEAITGLRMSEFRVEFGRDRSVSNVGTELYFLDGFPCFGQSDSSRVWISPSQTFAIENATNARMRIVCLYAPSEMKFAYREIRRDASQGRTTGLKVCPVDANGRQLRIDLRECERVGDWGDFR
ncbi:MAG: hypothetical protein FWC83_02665 [Alphaproteobacteria bacterium]|nr:hypothetical protein [Alphaproteobacteria bacterium]